MTLLTFLAPLYMALLTLLVPLKINRHPHISRIHEHTFWYRQSSIFAAVTCFTRNKVQILTGQLVCRARSDTQPTPSIGTSIFRVRPRRRGGRCSIYLRCWYKSTQTDAEARQLMDAIAAAWIANIEAYADVCWRMLTYVC